jgi:hypothetical protein
LAIQVSAYRPKPSSIKAAEIETITRPLAREARGHDASRLAYESAVDAAAIGDESGCGDLASCG